MALRKRASSLEILQSTIEYPSALRLGEDQLADLQHVLLPFFQPLWWMIIRSLDTRQMIDIEQTCYLYRSCNQKEPSTSISSSLWSASYRSTSTYLPFACTLSWTMSLTNKVCQELLLGFRILCRKMSLTLTENDLSSRDDDWVVKYRRSRDSRTTPETRDFVPYHTATLPLFRQFDSLARVAIFQNWEYGKWYELLTDNLKAANTLVKSGQVRIGY